MLKRIQEKAHDDNRSYAAELLSILMQDSRPNRLELGKQDGVEVLLKVASVRLLKYRPRTSNHTDLCAAI